MELLGHLQQGKYAIKSKDWLEFGFWFDRCPCDRFHLSNGVRSLVRHSTLYETCALPKLVGAIHQSVTASHHSFVDRLISCGLESSMKGSISLTIHCGHRFVYPFMTISRCPRCNESYAPVSSINFSFYAWMGYDSWRYLNSPVPPFRFSISKISRSPRIFSTWPSISWNWPFVT